MALATQCPHCHTRFRVAADQLKLRGGIVRCGSCQAIFDGSAHLIDLDAAARKDEPPAAAAPAVEAAPQVKPGAEAEAESTSEPAPEATTAAQPAPDTDLPVYTLELGHTLDPLGILPEAMAEDQAAAPGAPASYAPPERIEPSFGLPVDEELVAQPVRGEEAFDETPEPGLEPDTATAATEPAPEPPSDTAAHEAAPVTADAPQPVSVPVPASPLPAPAADVPPAALPLRASSGVPAAASIPPPPPSLKRAGKGGAKNARRSKLTPTRIEAPKLRVPDSDEPEFVKRSRRQEQTGRLRRLLMGAGAAILVLVLAAQLVLEYRNTLAARIPAVKPLLAGACVPFGCHVGLPAQVENLAIETGELSPLASTAAGNTYTLNTLLRNSGSLVQAWPSIQLELIDDAGKPLLRRIVKPSEYLPAASLAGGFAAHSEQPVRLDFALAGPKPAGYHLFVFYP